MKKILTVVAVMGCVLALAACGKSADTDKKSEGVMTYEEYKAAPLDSEVTIEAYVQAHQSWWDNKITVYAADRDGAYFLYEMACTEDEATKLTPGTKIKAKGYKSFASAMYEPSSISNVASVTSTSPDHSDL